MRVLTFLVLTKLFIGTADFSQETKLSEEFASRLSKIESDSDEVKQAIREKYQRELAAVEEKRLAELKALMEDTTKKADLDSAIVIRDKIRELETNQPSVDELLTERPSEARATASSRYEEFISSMVSKGNASSERFQKLILFAFWSPWNGCEVEPS
jgi:hypothetical protein